jgi:hypothetical protein
MNKTEKLENLEPSLVQKIKDLSIEWILSSTSHGLPNIFRTNQLYLKIVWLIFFLISSIACMFLIIKYMITFYDFEVTVSTKFEHETPIDFPAVTICNLNPFYKNRSFSFINTTLRTSKLDHLLFSTTLPTGETPLSLSKTIMATLKSEAATSPSLTSQSRTELGFYIEDMLISCYYAGTVCNSSDFNFFQSYDYGNCYTFNTNANNGGINKISSAGSGHGLELELFAGDQTEELFIYKRGFYVVVHNQSTSPIMDNEGVHVSTGAETNIGIVRTFYQKLGSPFSSCISDPTSNTSSTSELYQAILNELGEKSYRQKYCFKLCYQKEVLKTCLCYDPKYPNIPTFGKSTISSCRTTIEVSCMTNTSTLFEANDLNTQCSNFCPAECLTVDYALSITTATYPTDNYLNWLQLQTLLTNKYTSQSPLTTQITNSLAKVNVFYNDIAYISFTESEKISTEDLLGNIGGQLGLFIGISFLSVIEVVELGLEIIRTVYLHKKSNKIQ